MQSIDQIFCNIRQKQMERISRCPGLAMAGISVDHQGGYNWSIDAGKSRIVINVREPVVGVVAGHEPLFSIVEEIHRQLGLEAFQNRTLPL